MAATVRPIEAKAIHLIQSGQVIVDLCSVVKELVENSLDAEATAIEVRFKNNGLEEMEVQDNGTGVSASNYASIALKHHTSKLSTFDDLASLSTFGFRGEALSSLCALSDFTVTTAQAHEAPKGNRLEFEPSGKLKSTTVVACQKGTIASVRDLFQNLPVRRKELTKNIKREYGKVLGLLQAYACVSTRVKFTVKNTMPKAKTATAFATQSNETTRDNIANIYGAKTLSALAELDLHLEYQADAGRNQPMQVIVKGHISRPVFGEGRQTPDRQMFFVNGRPCGLPQIAKAINEVYRSFNVSQSPFIFADFQLDTNAYDVNVSPDKRSILLHNAAALTESLRAELTSMFDDHEQTVPQSQLRTPRLPAYKQLSIRKEMSDDNESNRSPVSYSHDPTDVDGSIASSRQTYQPNGLLKEYFSRVTSSRPEPTDAKIHRNDSQRTAEAFRAAPGDDGETPSPRVSAEIETAPRNSNDSDEDDSSDRLNDHSTVHVRDFNARMAEQVRNVKPDSREVVNLAAADPELVSSTKSASHNGIVQTAFDRMRPKRARPEVATITIGNETITKLIGGNSADQDIPAQPVPKRSIESVGRISSQQFSQRISRFSAFGAPADKEQDAHEPRTCENVDLPNQLRSTSSRSDESIEDITDDDDEVIDSSSACRNMSQISSREGEEPRDDAEDEAKMEDERVAQLILRAEETVEKAEKSKDRRTAQALKSKGYRDSVATLQITMENPLDLVAEGLSEQRLTRTMDCQRLSQADSDDGNLFSNEEERLSLSVAKSDFAEMHVVGQFNLGFILAVRQGRETNDKIANDATRRDELFIIDQHASDEKYNFERLQVETTVSNQKMVRPVTLDLTAVEEEILIDNEAALEKNGFVVKVDTTGDHVVGQRCQLVSLPVSKEVVFNTRDLDELIHLLSETPMLSDSRFVPRPSKVRKMFAMRACRSSIMIGKTLSTKQMSTVLQHLGSIDKPWNCPHGRPTMRHLASLDSLDSILWHEGDGICVGQDPAPRPTTSDMWKAYME